MTEFDQADCTLSTARRVLTTTPLQALTMMNHQFTLDMAGSLAHKVQSAGKFDLENQVAEVIKVAYQRKPENDEIARTKQLIRDHGLRALCRAILNSSELIYLD